MPHTPSEPFNEPEPGKKQHEVDNVEYQEQEYAAAVIDDELRKGQKFKREESMRQLQRIRRAQEVEREPQPHPRTPRVPPSKVFAVLQIQRLWRGHTVRRDIERVFSHGGSYSGYVAFTLLRSLKQIPCRPRNDLSIRQLPPTPFGSWHLTTPDTTPSKVSFYRSLRYWSPTRHHLAFISLFLIGTTICLYFIPGWCALILNVVFELWHTASTVEKMVGWVFSYGLITAFSLSVLRVLLVSAYCKFIERLEFVLCMIGYKHGPAICRDDLTALRTTDLNLAATCLYTDVPWAVIHSVHVLCGLATVMALDYMLALFNLTCALLSMMLLVLYDRLVVTQLEVEEVVHTYESRLGTVCAPSMFKPVRMALSKALMRMRQTYSRVHGMAFITVLMLVITLPVFFFYVGGLRVTERKLLVADFVFCTAYFIFTQASVHLALKRLSTAVLSRNAFTRLFKVSWHFREFSDRLAFRERECQIIQKVEGSKVQRAQPVSVSLGLVLMMCWMLIIGWMAYFTFRMDLECTSAAGRCSAYADGAEYTHDDISIQFDFSFFDGCVMRRPAAKLLKLCARNIASHRKWQLGRRFTTEVKYEGWKGRDKGFSKAMKVSAVNNGLIICPTDLETAPFLDTEELINDERSPLARGVVGHVHFNNADAVFFAANNFTGCSRTWVAPKGACSDPRDGLHRCWCVHGRPVDLSSIDCTEFTTPLP